MTTVTKKEAAKMAGISRTTLYRHIEEGKLSCVKDGSDCARIDVSELIRVYGEIKTGHDEHSNNSEILHDGNNECLYELKNKLSVLQAEYDMYRDMSQKRISELERDKEWLMKTADKQTSLLTYQAEKTNKLGLFSKLKQVFV